MAIHPGKEIKAQVKKHGITVNALANELGVYANVLYSAVAGNMGISAESALRLGRYFPGTTPETWMKLQSDYDLSQARKKLGKTLTEIRPLRN